VRTFHSLLALTGAALLAGCDSESAPPPPVRPVLSALAERQTLALNAFAGTIEPRYSSSLAFRAGGRVIAREVNAGDSVQKGARLAALDPLVFDLAVRDAQAGLANAIAVLDNATAAEKRYRILFEEKHTSSQQLEAAQQEKEAAEAAVTRARSVLEKAIEQRGYAELTAEYDGVVIAVDTEIGQVVAPGQPVITIARPDTREAVIDVPEDISVQEGSPFEIALQIAPSKRVSGKVREVAPQVHAMTRSRRVKIALESPSADFRLGTTVTAYAPAQTAGDIRIPVSAVFERGGKQQVWIVDSASRTVALRDVNVSSGDGRTAAVKAGLEPGDRVVTAGVNSLEPGQSVKIPEEAPK
jgi:membrane fusion protein, multidrug efflux system